MWEGGRHCKDFEGGREKGAEERGESGERGERGERGECIQFVMTPPSGSPDFVKKSSKYLP